MGPEPFPGILDCLRQRATAKSRVPDQTIIETRKISPEPQGQVEPCIESVSHEALVIDPMNCCDRPCHPTAFVQPIPPGVPGGRIDHVVRPAQLRRCRRHEPLRQISDIHELEHPPCMTGRDHVPTGYHPTQPIGDAVDIVVRTEDRGDQTARPRGSRWLRGSRKPAPPGRPRDRRRQCHPGRAVGPRSHRAHELRIDPPSRVR